ncbi:MAG: Ig-like domain-containing protein [Candidatus Margulisiibacteriota bacterium]
MTISFRAKDAQAQTCSLESFQYSPDSNTWYTPGDASAALGGGWPDNGGARFSSATDFSGTVHSFTFNTKHADISEFNGQYLTGAKVRFVLHDGVNSSTQATTTDAFTVDDLSPAGLITAETTTTPEAGATTVRVYGTFTEINPSTNVFYAALNGGNYGSGTTGGSGTAAPATQEVTVATLDGNDYISKIQIVETDTFGNVGTNENTSPSNTYIYVKPYTPLAPTVSNATATTVQLTINPHASETSAVEYAIFDDNESKYVQSNGTLGASAYWKTTSSWGTVTITGLTNSLNDFKVISRNPSNPALNTFSGWSAAGHAANSPPIGGYTSDYTIPAAQVSQATDGSGTVTVHFRAKSARTLTCSLEIFAYSTNGGSSWSAPTNGDASTALSGSWPDNSGARYNSATDFSGTVYSFTINTQHADLAGFNNAYLTTARVRFWLNDGANNSTQATTAESFTLDNLAPATLATANLTQTPEAGATNVSVYGTFTEINPSTNVFYAAVNGENYGSGIAGESGTAAPATQAVTVTTLNGDDYISKVKLVETDTFGNVGTNENTSPSTTYKYVKPYTPLTPSVNNATATTVDVAVNPYADEASTVTYAIYCVTTSQYVQASGTLGDSPVWQTAATWGTVTVTGLSAPLTTNFKVRAKNPNDASGNTLSNWGPTANASNTPPIGGYSSNYYIPSAQVSQSTNGSGILTISFRAKDAQVRTCSLEGFEYSTDGTTWSAPTHRDASASLAGTWPDNNGSRYNSATDFSGTVYSFTFNTKHADVSGFTNSHATGAKVRFLLQDGVDASTQVTTTAAIAVDNLIPATLITAEPTTQPQSGATVVSVYGTFTEINPASNLFYVALNGGSYGSAASGESGTASPATKEITVAVLNGDDYVSKVKIVATDTYGNVGTNENTSPSSTYKYVKPYTPLTPTVNNATTSTVDVAINSHADETSAVTYAIYDTYVSKYVQTSGTLDSTAVWQTKAAWGTITVTGLSSPLSHSFKVKSRNPSDTSNNTLSDWSPTGNASNIPPIGGYSSNYYIAATRVSQSTDGTGTMTISFRAKDAQSQSCSLESFAYSLDGTTWSTPLNGDASASLAGTWPDNNGARYNSEVDFSGTVYSFTFNTKHADVSGLTNTYTTTAKLRFLLNDGTDSSTQTTTTAAFTVDNLAPATLTSANITASLEAGATTVNVYGTFTEINPSRNHFYVGISGNDYGSTTTGESGTATPATCEVATSPLNGADYVSKVRIIATDAYGNVGTNENTSPSATYKYVKPYTPLTPTVNNATATTVDVAVNPYADESSAVEYAIYCATTSQYVQTGGTLGDAPVWKTATNWSTITVTGLSSPAVANFKVKSRNPYDASGNTISAWSSSGNASNTPPIGGYSNNYYIPAAQVSQSTDGLGIITVNFRVKDAQRQTCSLESFAYSIDDGSRWYTPINGDQSESLGGSWPDNHGARLSAEADFSGTLYSFTFDTRHSDIAGFNNAHRTNAKIRFLVNDGTDSSTQVTTTDAFAVDDLSPAKLATAEVVAQPQAGAAAASVYGTFTEINPSTNVFYAAINGLDYSGSTSGEGGTASPATCEVSITTLDGNDYVSKMKIVETDTFGNQGNNENLSPATLYKYVKPYAPLVPTAANPSDLSADITVRKATAETSGLEYAIYATHEGESGGQYVQANGFLGDVAVWQELGSWGTSGTISVVGLESPVRNYTFRTKSRNTSDTSHQSSSESNLSAGVQPSNNSTPEITSYTPSADAIGVDIMPVINAAFSEKMLRETVEFATAFTAVRDRDGNTISIAVTGEAVYNTVTKILSFVPDESLQYGYTYNFSIGAAAANLVGTVISNPISVNFTTICSSAESNTTISTDGLVWIVSPAGTLPQNGYFKINRDPVHSPVQVNPAHITTANAKVIAEGNPYHYPIETSITETLAYSASAEIISDLSKNVTLRMYYSDADSDGYVDSTSPQVKASDLLIYHLNETSSLWVRVPTSTVNTQSQYIYASAPRLGTYVLMATPTTDPSNAYAYPVPFKPSAGHTVITFTNLPSICTIKIYTIAGNLLKTITVSSSSGSATWDAKTDFGGNCASGVYIYLIESATDKKLGKLIIIR